MLRRVLKLPLAEGWTPPFAVGLVGVGLSRETDGLDVGVVSAVDRDSGARTQATR